MAKKTKPEYKAKIAAIIAEYVAENDLCIACVDRVIVESELEDLFSVVGDDILAQTIKDEFGDAALVTVSDDPEPDTLLFSEATVANLASYKETQRTSAKFLAIKGTIETILGRDLTAEELTPEAIVLLSK